MGLDLFVLAAAKLPFIENVLVEEGYLKARIKVLLSDGQPRSFDVLVTVQDGLPVARSSDNCLPKACPERHINLDGTFCIEWQPGGNRRRTSEDEAIAWWSDLSGFLFCQTIADVTGLWPKSHQWPHGDAARFQYEIEQLQPDLRSFVGIIEKEQLRASGGRLDHRRRPCPCGSEKRTKDCHEKDLVRIARLVEMRDVAEMAFWQGFRSVKCCSTMKKCPLAKGAS